MCLYVGKVARMSHSAVCSRPLLYSLHTWIPASRWRVFVPVWRRTYLATICYWNSTISQWHQRPATCFRDNLSLHAMPAVCHERSKSPPEISSRWVMPVKYCKHVGRWYVSGWVTSIRSGYCYYWCNCGANVPVIDMIQGLYLICSEVIGQGFIYIYRVRVRITRYVWHKLARWMRWHLLQV